jgi:hypothetical protein
MIPIILCCGANGRAVVYGRVEEEPTPGEPVTMHDARMIIRWEGRGGLFGVAAVGPGSGSRITHAVPRLVETCWQECLAVTPEAAEKIDGWPAE